MTGYVSPIPTHTAQAARRSIHEQPRTERVHMWPSRSTHYGDAGLSTPCNPALCRECERERTWSAGQTRGRAV